MKFIKIVLILTLFSGVAVANTPEPNRSFKQVVLQKMTSHIWQQKRMFIHEVDINNLQIHYSVYQDKNHNLHCTDYFKSVVTPVTGTEKDILFINTKCNEENIKPAKFLGETP